MASKKPAPKAHNEAWDGTLYSRSRVRPVQFWGLIIWGIALVGGGLAMSVIPMRLWTSAKFAADKVVICFIFGISAVIVLFGLLLLKRASAGR